MQASDDLNVGHILKAQTQVLKFSKVTPDADNIDPRLRLREVEFTMLCKGKKYGSKGTDTGLKS